MRTQCESQESLQDQLRKMQQRIENLEQEKQLLQEEKGQLEELLWATSKNTLSYLVILDHDLRIVQMFSPNGSDNCEQYLGKLPQDFIQHPGVAEFARIEEAALATGEVQRDEIKVTTPDGIKTYLTSAQSFTDSTGQLTGIAVTATDISERKQVEQILLEAEQLSAVGQLSAGVAHEFKNVLAVIMGSAQLLQVKMKKDEELFGEFLPKLATIVEQSKKGVTVATNMLTMARPNRSVFKFHDICEVIDKVLDLQQNQFGLEHIKIVRDYGEVPPVQMNAEQMEQVFLNLSINARHAMKKAGQGTITIQVQKLPRHLEIRFSDTGVGMSPEVQEKIFTPFFTTKGDENSNVKGSGLGLSIITQTLKAHNGTIQVESEEGKGTTFIIHLPIT